VDELTEQLRLVTELVEKRKSTRNK
jgi:hypothetical protein